MTVSILVLIVGIVIGLFARLDGLENRLLAVDEYYFVQGVQSLLEHGVPKFASGGYYMRGLLPQYLTAISTMVFGENGFGYRFPAVLFSLASIMLTYIYCQRFLGRSLAGVVALTLLVSSWHIEFARFARMYSAFQCVTLLFLIVIDKAYFQGKWHLRYLPHAVAFIAVLTHELGVLLLPLLLIPWLTGRTSDSPLSRSQMYRFGSASLMTIAVACLCFAFIEFKARSYGVNNAFPEGYIAVKESILRLPAFPFWRVSDNPHRNLGFLVGALMLVATVLRVWQRYWGGVKTTDILLALLLTATVLHAFVVSFACLALLLCRYPISEGRFYSKRSYVLFGISCLLGIGWIGYALQTPQWMASVGRGESGLLAALYRTFFGWPDFYTPFFVPWSRELPLLGMCMAGAFIYQVGVAVRMPYPVLLQHPACVAAYIIVCFGLLKFPFETTRYVFFLYPVLLALMVLSIKELVQKFGYHYCQGSQVLAEGIAVLLCLGVFASTRDFNPHHIANIATPRVEFRMAEFEPFARTWYARSDYRTPAHFLNQAVLDTDHTMRLVVVAQPPVSYYLTPDHAVYEPRTGSRFPLVSRMSGTLELWSNRRLLSTPEELRAYTAGAHTVWLVKASHAREQPFRIEEVWHGRFVSASRALLSMDGRIEVIVVRLTDTTVL
jgi:hypothetical protein